MNSTTTSASTSTKTELADLHTQARNSLQAALHLLTDTSASHTDPANFGRALARTLRASTSLKRCCTLAKEAMP